MASHSVIQIISKLMIGKTIRIEPFDYHSYITFSSFKCKIQLIIIEFEQHENRESEFLQQNYKMFCFSGVHMNSILHNCLFLNFSIETPSHYIQIA